MGLDMYLYKKIYVQNWDHHAPDQRHEITVNRGGQVREDINPERISYIIEQIAYWRKANAIHAWFVENCQDGVDDCREAYVDRDKLRELVDLCKRVLETIETVDGRVSTGTSCYPDGRVVQHTRPGAVVAQAAIAESLLPTQSGFFFGSTDYDEGYIDDLQQTVQMIEPELEDENGDFYYQASW